MGSVVKFMIAGTVGILSFVKGYKIFSMDDDYEEDYSDIDDLFEEDVDPDLDD